MADTATIFPGDTTAEDWSDDRYIFWIKIDSHTGEELGLSRSDLKRDRIGRVKPGQKDYRYRFCEEHFDWEDAYRPVSGVEALAWVHADNRKRGSAP